MADVGFAPSRSMAAEDIRDLQNWTRHNNRAYVGGASGWLFLMS